MNSTPRHEITLKKLVYTMPGVDAVTVRRDVPYRATETGALGMDIYYPPDAGSEVVGRVLSDQPGATSATLPAVIFAIGFSDVGARTTLGCIVKEMESYIGWARLVAASGMVAITYENREPVADLHAVLQHVREHGAALGIDSRRIGVMGFSGNGPATLSTLMTGNLPRVACAVLCYAYLLDLDGFTGVAEAQTQWRFANPCAGISVDDLPHDLPLFIARAGQDQFAGLNDALDRFVAKALARNLPVTFVNHATGQHAFDVLDDSATTRDVIRQILSFMRFHLLESPRLGLEAVRCRPCSCWRQSSRAICRPGVRRPWIPWTRSRRSDRLTH
ncbi:MAG: alpha/beta hydrolase [Acidobacteria bacterium]|nr:alpha/beta hydrolase [Acidobacteriota bacterium]